ncbi:nucleotide di-P-sugar epimerase or dehydratase [Rhodopirellula maiorica SM1]|uniref:GDP-L-fucose synthase n=1 Tax=Rhodopirellula maiorica SM1 TaxID=1265738 RepID=M5RSH3_9BACT|nr:GDP-L-fucose synthase [Rhodopirellula maiorica]EMI18322.1 nucleotide di-P-sugar epimerase or dehydratase [Rhodopirellula maiorica SM1]
MTEITGKIYVAGHRGMVGSAVCRRLASEKNCEVLTATRDTLDLTNQSAVEDFFAQERPDAVVFAAARVGGVLANDTYPVEFLGDNLLMSTFAINAAYAAGVKRFLFLGSTCIYPRDCPQPIQEDALLTGPLEKTNEAYALAKIAGLKLCQFYRRQHGGMFHSAMPTNLYGPGDNYHPQHSHVLPALLRRFHEATQQGVDHVTIWGTGTPRREFLYVDDLADALAFLLTQQNPPDWVNVGTGVDLSILGLAHLVAETVGYQGEIKTDPSKPDGTPVKCSDVSRLKKLGWNHKVALAEGLKRTYDHFLSELESGLMRSV